jgi:hypothetical protein
MDVRYLEFFLLKFEIIYICIQVFAPAMICEGMLLKSSANSSKVLPNFFHVWNYEAAQRRA